MTDNWDEFYPEFLFWDNLSLRSKSNELISISVSIRVFAPSIALEILIYEALTSEGCTMKECDCQLKCIF